MTFSSWQPFSRTVSTGDSVVLGETALPPHTAGPALHVHSREDEAIYMIAGVLTCVVGERRFEAGPSTLVWLPRDVPHAVANLGDEPVRTIGYVTPAGLEAMLAEQAAYLDSVNGPADDDALASIASRFGVTAVGPPLAVD